ncbi:argininosuccinate lyase [Candidatus Woesearchaeota archaeon]|nr:argininosuccinate lyase [Candidatus Woesearchaeota archaeon]
MAKLWQTSGNLAKDIEEFTVGEDYLLDQKLVKFDCKASIAHAKMLLKMGILSSEEFGSLAKALSEIIALEGRGKFTVKQEDEDCHTAIENHLTKYLGDLGKKIHTARSRNDQVLAALRLFEREQIFATLQSILALIKGLKKTASVSSIMPGYTHMRKAMPSSVKLWATAFIEAMEDDVQIMEFSKKIINKNPLGTGAGYGLPLEVDKETTRAELAFGENFMSPISAQNSRLKYESIILHGLSLIMGDLNKLASDLLLFTMPEFGFFSLPDELATGSSIMPQKKNPDVLELIRGKYSVVAGFETQVKILMANLPSGYHRDFQLSKGPVMKSFAATQECLKMMIRVINALIINKKNLEKSCTSELFATQKAYALVKKGMPFREAYRKIKENS